MKNKTKILKFLPLFAIFLSVLFIGDQVSATSDLGITSIEHSPSTLIQGENLTVTVVFYDTTNISQVKLLLCTITPEFLCEPQPILMVEMEAGTYEGKFLVDYDIGTTVGYHIKIVYENFTSVIIPETPTFLDMDIIEPITGFYFFDAGAVQQRTDSAGCCGIIGTVLAIGSTSLIAKQKKKLKN
ncbi:MAG: hypothetical protein GOP50_11905 [Candidatus Heimdallarchaeota archaeon]|nr:hypothetical protein [Candidatus Heimdallarchaeota archaeon]